MTTFNFTQLLDQYPDFPREGILFYDIAPILRQPEALRQLIEALKQQFSPISYDAICGIDSRGFIFGSLLAFETHKPFFMARKPGKLPGKTIQASYDMEYGSNSLEIQTSVIEPGQKILIIDDLLATGNTARSTAHLIEQAGGIVAALGFIIELKMLNGRAALENYQVESLIVL